ncbi:MAG: exosortase/archaeosortase family protein [bacterium]|nr:exosortase/archaeosortase family protein [bacterium]
MSNKEHKIELIERDKAKSFILYCIFSIISALGLYILYRNSNLEISPICLLLISLFCGIKAIIINNPSPYSGINYGKWFTLYLGFAILFLAIVFNLYSDWIFQLSIFFIALSVIAYFGGQRIMVKLILPLAVLLLLLPFYQHFYYWFSYPLRLISTKLTVATLSVFGMNISAETTVISVGSKKVAITAACSGLVLLETLTWIGWLIVIFLHKLLLNKFFHFLMIVPIVFISNTIRLIILVLLFSKYGEIVIISPLHMWLGYLMVLLASLIFYYCKYLFNTGLVND